MVLASDNGPAAADVSCIWKIPAEIDEKFDPSLAEQVLIHQNLGA